VYWKISANVIWGKNMKREEKRGKMLEKKEERERKRKKGESKEKMGTSLANAKQGILKAKRAQ
jgi:hypothetical protein